VQNKLFGKKNRKTNNKDSTHTDTDIFFANDYKAAKVRAFKYTRFGNMHELFNTHTHTYKQEKKIQTKKF
jgi:hypothetical protein